MKTIHIICESCCAKFSYTMGNNQKSKKRFCDNCGITRRMYVHHDIPIPAKIDEEFNMKNVMCWDEASVLI